MRPGGLALVAVAASLLCAPAALAGPAEDLRRGNEAFLGGDAGAAVTAYEAALSDGDASADLYYNLGTAAAQAGRLGQAAWAFEQALLLEPGHEDARHNMQRVRARIIEEGAADGTRVILPGDDDLETGLFTLLGPSEATWGFAACWALLFALLLLVRRARDPGRRTALTFAAVVAALAALATGGLLVGRLLLVRSTEYAVVVDDAARVRPGPGAQYRAGARVLPGVKVRVVGEDAGWRRITLPDGSDGWVPDEATRPLRMQ